jgi:hypothetical protein
MLIGMDPLYILFLMLVQVPGVGDEGEQGGHLQACPQNKYTRFL